MVHKEKSYEEKGYTIWR